jgi:hypothetical protein
LASWVPGVVWDGYPSKATAFKSTSVVQTDKKAATRRLVTVVFMALLLSGIEIVLFGESCF